MQTPCFGWGPVGSGVPERLGIYIDARKPANAGGVGIYPREKALGQPVLGLGGPCVNAGWACGSGPCLAFKWLKFYTISLRKMFTFFSAISSREHSRF